MADEVAEPEVLAEVVPEAEKPPEPEKPSKPPEGYVPHQALHAERLKAKRLEAELQEERKFKQTIAQRLEAFNKPEVKEPDPNEDPAGAIIHEVRANRQEVAEIRKQAEERDRRFGEDRQRQEMERRWAAASQNFATKQPDFAQAYDFLFREFIEDLRLVGYDESQVEKVAGGYWQDVVAAAQRDGINPAERFYDLAKRRGYKASSKTETIANGMKATSPLSGAGGKAPANHTPEYLANCSQREFDEIMAKNPELFSKLFA